MAQDFRLSAADIAELLQVVMRIAEHGQCTPSDAIRRIASAFLDDGSAKECRSAELAEFATRWRLLRQRRNELVGAPLFRDPAWDMLLELFAAHEGGRMVTVTSLCFASGVPQTTALRHLLLLEEHELVTRRSDSADNRLFYVEATARAISAIANIAAMFVGQSRTIDSMTTGKRSTRGRPPRRVRPLSLDARA